MAEDTAVFNVWNQRNGGSDLPETKLLDSVSDDDIEYICAKYPFIQLINTNATFGEEVPVNLITASTNWIIHDYGEAISTSAPHTQNSGRGIDIVSQAKTLEEIANIIAEKGWTSVELIAGTALMKRFLWLESQRIKFTLNGYTPEPGDQKYCDRLFKYAKDMGIVWEHAVIKVKKELSATGVSGAE